MKTIIAGSRGVTDYAVVERAILASKFTITEVVSGTAKGVDKLGEHWASENDVPVKLFKPSWGMHGNAAGMMRNRNMAKYADALVAVWDGKSPGTKDMIEVAQKLGLKVHVAYVGAPKPARFGLHRFL